MLLSMIMLFMTYASPDGEVKYKQALSKSVEATYANSDIKRIVDEGNDHIKRAYPGPTLFAASGYSIAVQHKIRFTNAKVGIIPGAVTSLDATKTQATLSLTWHF